MKILILGSEGFIGRHLVKYYLSNKMQVFGADLLEAGSQPYYYYKISRLSPEYDDLLKEIDFHVCINAGGSGNVPYSMSHPFSDFEANSLDVIKLLDGIRRFRPSCKYLHISSAAVYGNPVSLPINERSVLQPLSAYGWHKLMSENICHEYTSIYKIQTAIARPFSVYGPGLKKQLFWDIYQKMRDPYNEGEVKLWGTGSESRDFIFIDDLVNCFDVIIQKGEMQGEEYNVASGSEVTIREVATLLIKEYGKPLSLKFNQNVRSGDPLNWRANIEKVKFLGFTCKTNLNEGVKKTTEWLKNQN